MKNHRPYAGFTLVEIMVVVVIIGLLSSMAISTFRTIRASAQDKVVSNNLRQLASAANTYFTSNGGISVATTELMGTDPTQFLKPFVAAAGENYTPVIVMGQPITASGIAGARTLTYNP